jgi:hypothetical protein
MPERASGTRVITHVVCAVLRSGWMGFHSNGESMRWGVGTEKTSSYGGLCGANIRPLALKGVTAIRKAVPDSVIMATGGIDSADVALQFLYAGAPGHRRLASRVPPFWLAHVACLAACCVCALTPLDCRRRAAAAGVHGGDEPGLHRGGRLLQRPAHAALPAGAQGPQGLGLPEPRLQAGPPLPAREEVRPLRDGASRGNWAPLGAARTACAQAHGRSAK